MKKIAITLVLVLTIALPAQGQAISKITGRTGGAVDLTSKESRRRWINEWLSSATSVMEQLEPEEAAEYGLNIVKVGLRNSRNAIDKLPSERKQQFHQELFGATVGEVLPCGDYLGLPADGSAPFSWRTATGRNGRNSFDTSPEQIFALLRSKSMTTEPNLGNREQQQQQQQQQQQSAPMTLQPMNQNDPASIEKYKKWRKSFAGRMYAVRMGNDGFVPLYDPVTGIEKWVPKNSIGITKF